MSASAAVGVISKTEQTVVVSDTNIVYIHKAITINGRPSQRQEEACKVDKIN